MVFSDHLNMAFQLILNNFYLGPKKYLYSIIFSYKRKGVHICHLIAIAKT